MSEHGTACTCDRCQMMVMPTSPTVSERMRSMQLGVDKVLALEARVAELELDREGRIRSSDYDKALIEELEAENAKLRKCVKAGDAFRIKVQAAENYCAVSGIYSLAALHGIRYEGPVWKGELEDYLAARAEVDK